MDALQTIHPELLVFSQQQIHALVPYFWVFFGVVLCIVLSTAKKWNPKWPVFVVCLGTLGMALLSSIQHIDDPALLLFHGMWLADGYSNFFNALFLLSAICTVCISFRYLDKEKLQYPEYYLLLLFSVLGMMLMVAVLDLVVLLITLELMSISLYVLVGFRRADRRSNEAAVKYFILGSLASAIFLYGVALLYGSTGTTGMKEILHIVQTQPLGTTPIFFLGAAFVLFGFFFKVAVVPFHMWMPDVYEGAPIPVTAWMTTGIKAAAFAALMRLFVSMGYGGGLAELLVRHFHQIFWCVAALTMVVGNGIALVQTQLKRMLAYSSIAHSGYILLGILSSSPDRLGVAPSIFYLVVYAVMNLGAFGVFTLLSGREDSSLTLEDLSGLSQRHPYLAFALAVFFFSMAGLPPTAGFAAKYLLFYSAVQAQEMILVFIAVLCSAVSVYYYLRVLVLMYMKDPIGSPAVLRVSWWSGAVLVGMVFLTLYLGIMPDSMLELAKKIALGL